MRKLLVVLGVILSLNCSSQCDSCKQSCDRPAIAISLGNKGLAAEVVYVAQETRVGFAFGGITNIVREKVHNPNKEQYEYISYLSGGVSAHIYYKLIYKPERYSLHALTGAMFHLENGLYPYAGAELRKAARNGKKIFFMRATYPYDIRLGIMFDP